MMLYLFGMWENGSRGDGIQNRKGDWVRFSLVAVEKEEVIKL